VFTEKMITGIGIMFNLVHSEKLKEYGEMFRLKNKKTIGFTNWLQFNDPHPRKRAGGEDSG
jgi:hypothetical protein